VSFAGDLQKFAKSTNLEIETVVRKVAFDIYKGITQKTPVDTGRAKANWNIGLGAIDYTIRKENKFIAVPPRKGTGKKPIFITNSLPYINALENGSSTQAPNGMVNLTMLDAQRSIRNAIR
tara:strand:- start:320 stop:682 length:363 start_codon:yes stop_codon:yes gene_type:complete